MLVERYLDREELDGLMWRADSYVSLHRSEGFGQTLAETMAIGKPVIATGYSGNIEFMDSRQQHPGWPHSGPRSSWQRALPARHGSAGPHPKFAARPRGHAHGV